jgi:hypothetical protein
MIARLKSVPVLHAALALWLVFTTAASAGEPFRQISGKEITRRFSGQEFTDEVHWTYVFLRGGRLSSVSMGMRVVEYGESMRIGFGSCPTHPRSTVTRCGCRGREPNCASRGSTCTRRAVSRSQPPARNDGNETPIGAG